MRIFAVLLLVPLLGGCARGDWEYLTSFGAPRKAVAPAPAAPVTATRAAPTTVARAAPVQAASAPAPDPFCMAVAKQDAMENGFDPATQGKVALRSYQQCVQVFGSVAER